jgi:hypothetical protein
MPLTWPVSVSVANSGLTGAAPRGLETLAPQPAGMPG